MNYCSPLEKQLFAATAATVSSAAARNTASGGTAGRSMQVGMAGGRTSTVKTLAGLTYFVDLPIVVDSALLDIVMKKGGLPVDIQANIRHLHSHGDDHQWKRIQTTILVIQLCCSKMFWLCFEVLSGHGASSWCFGDHVQPDMYANRVNLASSATHIFTAEDVSSCVLCSAQSAGGRTGSVANGPQTVTLSGEVSSAATAQSIKFLKESL